MKRTLPGQALFPLLEGVNSLLELLLGNKLEKCKYKNYLLG